MTNADHHDAWHAGGGYDAYMGRWSRRLAPRFLEWLDAPPGLDWLDVGCGTGALSSVILAQCAPRDLIGIEPAEGFLARARENVADPRARFEIGDAQALPLPEASRDVVASALVLNFVPDRAKALAEMRRVARPGGRIGFYVWDYPGGGIELMRAFWDAATTLDPAASDFAEGKRFPFCTQRELGAMAEAAGLAAIETIAIEIPTVFRDFEDYWHPFTLGVGPAPGYCASLPDDARGRLRDRLQESLSPAPDGTIALKARAWAVKSLAP
jgi:ubiquinone/menaquinone biosynthesis C-methylase UbiE